MTSMRAFDEESLSRHGPRRPTIHKLFSMNLIRLSLPSCPDSFRGPGMTM